MQADDGAATSQGEVAAGVELGREDAAGHKVLHSPQVQHRQRFLSQGKLLILQPG